MLSVVTLTCDEERFSPATLQQLCIRFCNSHAKSILLSKPKKDKLANDKLAIIKGDYKLKKSVHLPNHIWEQLLEDYDRTSDSYLPLICAVVRSRKNFRLQKINLSNSRDVTDDELRILLESYPVSLNVHNCSQLTKKAVDVINEFGKNLECLVIGNSSNILPTDVDSWIWKHREVKKPHGFRKFASSITSIFTKRKSSPSADNNREHGMFVTPSLKKLVILGHHITQMQQIRVKSENSNLENGDGDLEETRVSLDYWEYIMRDFIHKLEYLDLSSCQEIVDLSFLMKAKSSLRYLYLHDVLLDYDERTWGILRNLTELRFLDVSQYNELASVFANPDVVLEGIVTSLPHLIGLDISGTNLSGFEPDRLQNACGIVGLKSRVSNPLRFLGLLAAHYNASNRQNIPAASIAGGSNMEQLLTALKHYLHRSNSVKKAIRMLHEKIQDNTHNIIPSHTFLRLLLEVMNIHVEDKHTVIVAMATIYHVLRRIYNGTPYCESDNLYKVQTGKIIFSLLQAMEIHQHDLSLSRNGVLILVHLAPYTQLNLYTKTIAKVLIRVGSAALAGSELYLVKAITYLLYNAINSSNKQTKEWLGGNGIIKDLCQLIDEMHDKNLMDHMSVCWTMLWNLTLGIDKNQSSFVDTDGIALCFRCIKFYCDLPESNIHSESIRRAGLLEAQIPLLATLTNILKGNEFEAKIINEENIRLIEKLFEKRFEENKKLFFHLCGFLCNIASKRQIYNLQNPNRQQILRKILQTIIKLDHNADFDNKYNYLTPLYELLEVKDAPEVRVWALWTLVNLTVNDPDKYIEWIISDGKVIVERLDNDERFYAQDDEESNKELVRLCNILKNNINTHCTRRFSLEE